MCRLRRSLAANTTGLERIGVQGLHEAGYEVIIVGHSLGAGAAALLALIFTEK